MRSCNRTSALENAFPSSPQTLTPGKIIVFYSVDILPCRREVSVPHCPGRRTYSALELANKNCWLMPVDLSNNDVDVLWGLPEVLSLQNQR